jgi:zinc protease
MGEDDPSRRLFIQTMKTAYQQHPYRRPIIGYAKTIRSIQRQEMLSFYHRWYVPDRMVFIAVGDFTPEEMERKVRSAFKDFRPSSAKFLQRAAEPEPEAFRSAVTYGNLKETYLQIALPISSARDEDTPALDALSHILGGGEASRLVQKVKLEKGLVNSISTSSFTPRDPGVFIVGATLRAENLEKAIDAILTEVALAGREGVTSEELNRVKVNVESSLIYDRQTVQGEARKLGYYEVTAGDVHFEKEYLRRVRLLQKEDLQKVVEKYFKHPRWVMSVIAPSEKKDRVKNVPAQSIFEKERPGARRAETKPAALKTVLDNGIRLIVKENRSNPIVTVEATFLGGVRFEAEGQNGISQFMAVMLTKGTKRQKSVEIAKKVERMAGSLSGFSGYNAFGLTFTFLAQHFDEASALFGEILKEPSFDEEELEKRRRLTLASIEQQEDDLDRTVFKLFRKTLFAEHPYRMDSLGTLDSVRKLTQKDLKDFYRRIVVPENMVLTIVGDIDSNQAVQFAKREFGGLRKGTFRPPRVPQERPLREMRRGVVHKKKEQAHFVLGFLGTTLDHKDRYAMDVLDAALSGQGGRLFYELRDKQSLAYALGFIANPNLDRGFAGVYMATYPEKLKGAIDGVLGELKKVRDEGLREEEVARAKRFLIGNFEIGLQTNAALANQMSLDELYGLGFEYYQRYPGEILKVTREDVQRVAREYLNLEAYALAIIQPPAEKKE